MVITFWNRTPAFWPAAIPAKDGSPNRKRSSTPLKKSSRKKSEALNSLRGRKVLVTAGPTREFFDPVRFLSNPSSGKMGYAIAEEAAKRGAKVTLISGPTSLVPSSKLKFISVTTAVEMHRAVIREAKRSQVVIMTAAVSDYRPVSYSRKKLKKGKKTLALRLVATPDILKELGKKKKPGQLLIGFAAETDRVLKNAMRKLRAKNLDLIVANKVGKNLVFDKDENQVFVLSAKKTVRLGRMPKKKIASKLFDIIKGR